MSHWQPAKKIKKSSAVIIGESEQNGLFIQSGNFFVKEASSKHVSKHFSSTCA